jgi:hypothetical protein
MKSFHAFIAFVLVASISVSDAHAASRGTGGGGLGFSCDVNNQSCSCDGVLEGADCQAMLKNCKAGSWACIESPPPAYCTCTMASRQAPAGRRIVPPSTRTLLAPE